jgi:hypothetical protein
LAVNVALNNAGQLRILKEDCGILSITALKDSVSRDANVKDDPTSNGNLVFIRDPLTGGSLLGGCLTIQFNKIFNGDEKKGVELLNMIVTEIDDGATAQVSGNRITFHFESHTAANTIFVDNYFFAD